VDGDEQGAPQPAGALTGALECVPLLRAHVTVVVAPTASPRRDVGGAQPGEIGVQPLSDVIVRDETDVPVRAHDEGGLVAGPDIVDLLHRLGRGR
jgi:hypothetical protein